MFTPPLLINQYCNIIIFIHSPFSFPVHAHRLIERTMSARTPPPHAIVTPIVPIFRENESGLLQTA
jgi:hypothetical protein